MNLSDLVIKTHFREVNLADIVEQLGEDSAKEILSEFSCPINLDVQNFLCEKAIEFSRQGLSKTHLVFWETDDFQSKELVGYYTIASKFITIQRSSVNSREARKLRAHGIFNEKTNEYTVSAPLIGQLGKNYTAGNNTLISGDDLLKLAMEKVKKVQREVGGKFVYLECEDKEKLRCFYEKNNFKLFGKRTLDRDETDIVGGYLLQYFAML